MVGVRLRETGGEDGDIGSRGYRPGMGGADSDISKGDGPGLISGSGTGSNKPSCFICRLSKACRRAASSRRAGRGLSCLVDCKVDPLAVGSSFGNLTTCGENCRTLLGGS